MLAFLDVSAKLFGLLEGQPERAGITGQFRRRPQHQNIDAVIFLAVVPQGSGNRAGGILGVPRLVPGPYALLKRLDNLRGDTGVNVNAGCGGSRGTHGSSSVKKRIGSNIQYPYHFWSG